MNLGLEKPGACQTASVLSPYIYAEDNWTDDMELAAATQFALQKNKKTNAMLDTSYAYARDEPITPWLGKDTANHYQWYPFINIGHYELAKELTAKDEIPSFNFIKKESNEFGKKQNQMHFIVASLLSGAAIISQ